MKPIEPGALVMLVKAAPWSMDAIGKCFTVTGTRVPHRNTCDFCDSNYVWPLSDKTFSCACCLIRIDDDPDAVTEPEQHEVEA